MIYIYIYKPVCKKTDLKHVTKVRDGNEKVNIGVLSTQI